jgi:hypothetical protein
MVFQSEVSGGLVLRELGQCARVESRTAKQHDQPRRSRIDAADQAEHSETRQSKPAKLLNVNQWRISAR